nr:hypothetical protein Iba_chr03aCG9220 [Ipomoea batatas]
MIDERAAANADWKFGSEVIAFVAAAMVSCGRDCWVVPRFQEMGRGFDSKELKLRFVEENLGGKFAKVPILLRFDEEEGAVEVKSRTIVGCPSVGVIDEVGM